MLPAVAAVLPAVAAVLPAVAAVLPAVVPEVDAACPEPPAASSRTPALWLTLYKKDSKVRIGFKLQRENTHSWHCSCCCLVTMDVAALVPMVAACLESLLAQPCVVIHPVQGDSPCARKAATSVFAWAEVSAPFLLPSTLVDLLPGRPPNQLVCTLTSQFLHCNSGCARMVYSGHSLESVLCPRLGGCKCQGLQISVPHTILV